MNRLADQAFIVTGASSGIGRASALRLAEEGARVVLVARDQSRLEEARDQMPGEGHIVHACDVTDEDAIADMAKALREAVGEVKGLVHCAGIHWLRPLKVTRTGELQEMLNSHVVSSIALTRAMVGKRLAAKDGCSIVWFSSAAALQGGTGTVAYACAKGALISGARVVAVELASRNVRVNVIVPGVVRTPQSDAFLANLTPEQVEHIEACHLLGFGEPEDVSGVVAFLLSDDARWITGTTIVVDGGLTAH